MFIGNTKRTRLTIRHICNMGWREIQGNMIHMCRTSWIQNVPLQKCETQRLIIRNLALEWRQWHHLPPVTWYTCHMWITISNILWVKISLSTPQHVPHMAGPGNDVTHKQILISVNFQTLYAFCHAEIFCCPIWGPNLCHLFFVLFGRELLWTYRFYISYWSVVNILIWRQLLMQETYTKEKYFLLSLYRK